MAYFEKGTPQSVIDVAKRRLGENSVFILDKVYKMKFRWAYSFEPASVFNFRGLADDLKGAGLKLANPQSSLVTRLTVDGMPVEPSNLPSGNQIPSSLELAQLVSKGGEVPFQWWIN
jgi:hypothetical protein